MGSFLLTIYCRLYFSFIRSYTPSGATRCAKLLPKDRTSTGEARSCGEGEAYSHLLLAAGCLILISRPVNPHRRTDRLVAHKVDFMDKPRWDFWVCVPRPSRFHLSLRWQGVWRYRYWLRARTVYTPPSSPLPLLNPFSPLVFLNIFL